MSPQSKQLRTFTFHLALQVLFDEFGCIKKFETTDEILRCFFKVRLQKYHDRKEFLLGMLDAECAKLENQARFILEKIEGKIIIGELLKKNSPSI